VTIDDEEAGNTNKQLPLCTLCDTEIIDGKEVPTDKVLTSDLDFGMRLLFDYVLLLDHAATTKKDFYVTKGSTTVHKFFPQQNDGVKRPYTQISDHYGISFDICLNCT